MRGLRQGAGRPGTHGAPGSTTSEEQTHRLDDGYSLIHLTASCANYPMSFVLCADAAVHRARDPCQS
ncbi:hypothetical protein BD626DRAFT_433376, partial [Schizophyllum amplum]